MVKQSPGSRVAPLLLLSPVPVRLKLHHPSLELSRRGSTPSDLLWKPRPSPPHWRCYLALYREAGISERSSFPRSWKRSLLPCGPFQPSTSTSIDHWRPIVSGLPNAPVRESPRTKSSSFQPLVLLLLGQEAGEDANDGNRPPCRGRRGPWGRRVLAVVIVCSTPRPACG